MSAVGVELGLPRGLFVRLEQETEDGNWVMVAAFPVSEVLSIQVEGNQMLSCGCGSYAYGECELCAAELEAAEAAL